MESILLSKSKQRLLCLTAVFYYKFDIIVFSFIVGITIAILCVLFPISTGWVRAHAFFMTVGSVSFVSIGLVPYSSELFKTRFKTRQSQRWIHARLMMIVRLLSAAPELAKIDMRYNYPPPPLSET